MIVSELPSTLAVHHAEHVHHVPGRQSAVRDRAQNAASCQLSQFGPGARRGNERKLGGFQMAGRTTSHRLHTPNA
jgi:hypothetical protein